MNYNESYLLWKIKENKNINTLHIICDFEPENTVEWIHFCDMETKLNSFASDISNEIFLIALPKMQNMYLGIIHQERIRCTFIFQTSIFSGISMWSGTSGRWNLFLKESSNQVLIQRWNLVYRVIWHFIDRQNFWFSKLIHRQNNVNIF